VLRLSRAQALPATAYAPTASARSACWAGSRASLCERSGRVLEVGSTQVDAVRQRESPSFGFSQLVSGLPAAPEVLPHARDGIHHIRTARHPSLIAPDLRMVQEARARVAAGSGRGTRSTRTGTRPLTPPNDAHELVSKRDLSINPGYTASALPNVLRLSRAQALPATAYAPTASARSACSK